MQPTRETTKWRGVMTSILPRPAVLAFVLTIEHVREVVHVSRQDAVAQLRTVDVCLTPLRRIQHQDSGSRQTLLVGETGNGPS